MVRSFYFREESDRCRRLGRDSTDTELRDGPFRVAEEYATRATAEENEETAVWNAATNDDGVA
jgi:hypothetical protein